jgi:hypothetical protein
MTRRLPATRAAIRTAILAAQEAGLRVTGVRPDGTVMTAAGPPPDFSGAPLTPDMKPRDAREKLGIGRG